MSPIVADINRTRLAQRKSDFAARFADIGAIRRLVFSFHVIQSPLVSVKFMAFLRLSYSRLSLSSESSFRATVIALSKYRSHSSTLLRFRSSFSSHGSSSDSALIPL